MSTLATDDFNRADSGSLGANWSAFSVSVSSPSIVSNKAEDTGGADSGAIYSAATFPADQWAQVVRTGGDGGGVVLRGATPRTWYSVHIEGTFGASATLLFAKFLVGAFTSVSSQTVTFNSGDTLYAEIQGTTLLAKRNGAALGVSTTDGSIGSGTAGVFGFGAYIADDFSAGDFAAGGTTVTRKYPRFPNKGRRRKNYAPYQVGFRQGIATTPATFKAAWARGSNVVIQPGRSNA